MKAKLILACTLATSILTPLQAGTIIITSQDESKNYKISHSAAWLCKTLREHFTPLEGENIEARQLVIWNNPETIFSDYTAPTVDENELKLIIPILEETAVYYKTSLYGRNEDVCIDAGSRRLLVEIICDYLANNILQQLKTEQITTASIATLILAAQQLRVPEIKTAATWAAARYLRSQQNAVRQDAPPIIHEVILTLDSAFA